MPKGKLTRGAYLRQSNTRLKKNNALLREENKFLKKQIGQLKHRIKELEEKLEGKESQRKQLLSYLYKPNTSKTAVKKPGKKKGARGYQRPKPKDEEVTEFREFPLSFCTTCEASLGKPVDTVVKYEEDIDYNGPSILDN